MQTAYQKWYELRFQQCGKPIYEKYEMSEEEAREGLIHKDKLPSLKGIEDPVEKKVVAGLIYSWWEFVKVGEQMLWLIDNKGREYFDNFIKEQKEKYPNHRSDYEINLAMEAAQEERDKEIKFNVD